MNVERVEKGSLVLEGIPDLNLTGSDRLMQYQNTRSASVVDFDHENGIFIRTRFGETAQLHHVKHAGGARQQLSFFSDPVAGASLCPDPSVNALLFSMDQGGGEFFQLFRFDLNSSEWQLLTDGKSKNGAAVWSPNGDCYAYYSTRRTGTDWYV
jgi:Tol biopolymer transport system component